MRNNDLQIILTDIDDLKEIVDLNYQIFLGMYEHEPYNLEKYKDRLKDKKYFILKASVAENLVANAISYIDDDVLYLWIMGVDKNFRRQGVAKKLLDYTEKIAKDNNLDQVTAKVYDVSPEMKNCLLRRNYKLSKIEESKIDKKYNINYYFLKIK